MSKEKEILDWCNNTKFRKKILGGVDEEDVWKKIKDLIEMYEEELKYERARCAALMEYHSRKTTR